MPGYRVPLVFTRIVTRHRLFRLKCLTFEYMRLRGRLMAMLSTQTKLIFSMTRRLVLFRPNFIGYRRLRYRSTLMVHKCMMLAVHNNTSRQIHARQ